MDALTVMKQALEYLEDKGYSERRDPIVHNLKNAINDTEKQGDRFTQGFESASSALMEGGWNRVEGERVAILKKQLNEAYSHTIRQQLHMDWLKMRLHHLESVIQSHSIPVKSCTGGLKWYLSGTAEIEPIEIIEWPWGDEDGE